MILTALNCKRCGHKWFPRAEKLPVACPKCKSPYWNKSRKKEITVIQRRII